MRRRRRVNHLPGKNIHPLDGLTNPLELRQVRVKVKGIDLPKQAKVVPLTLNLDGCRCAIRRRRRSQTEAVLNRYAEPTQQRPRETPESLSGRDAMVTVVTKFRELEFTVLLYARALRLSDVVMGTNENQVIGMVEEAFDRLYFRRGCSLIGAQRVEADHDDAIDTVEGAIESRQGAIIGDAFDLYDRMAGQKLGLFGKGLEIGFLYMVQKSGDTLVDGVVVRQHFEFWIKKPAQLEYGGKAIFDDTQSGTGLRWTAPREIEKEMTSDHSGMLM